MGKANTGSNLIFIACQPRSGSTLLQRILGAHSEVHTISEPWLMLHPLYALREEGIQAEYGAGLAHTALQSVFSELPNGRQDYIEGVRGMYQTLYGKLLEPTDATLFLDKTPRYYFILPELREVFPEARYILLVRHPLAVFTSILRTWVKDNWLSVSKYKKDLLDAPRTDTRRTWRRRRECNPHEVRRSGPASRIKLRKVCDHLQIDFEPTMIQYGRSEEKEWKFGDPESVYKHDRPQTSSLEKWTQPKNAQEWRLLWEYAQLLGSDIFDAFGYAFHDCTQKLERVKPSDRDLRYTVSLEYLLEEKSEGSKRWARHRLGLTDRVREDGITGVAHYIGARAKSRLGL